MTKTNKKAVTKEIKKKSSKDKPSKDSKKKTFTKNYDLSGSKRVWPSFFNENQYIHFKDVYKQKNLTLTINEAKLFVKYFPKLEKTLLRLEREAIEEGKDQSSSGSDTAHSDSEDSA